MEAYEYQPLPSARHIRVVRLQKVKYKHQLNDPIVCQVETLDMDDPERPEFWTASYTWGDPRPQDEHCEDDVSLAYQRALFDVQCDGATIKVRKNLFDALHVFRREADLELIWIDAICIHQADVDERNSQLAMMGDIYAVSSINLIWLGNHDENSRTALPLIDKLGPRLLDPLQPETRLYTSRLELLPAFNDPIVFEDLKVEPFTTEQWKSIVRFLQRTWFYRVWTLQECTLPTHAAVCCGLDWCGWGSLTSFCDFFLQLNWGAPAISLISLSLNQNTAFNLLSGVAGSWIGDTATPDETKAFEEALSRFSGTGDLKQRVAGYVGYLIALNRERSSSDPRDKVFALLSLAARFEKQSVRLVPLPDYNRSKQETYTEVVKYVIRGTKKLTLLSQVGNTIESADYMMWTAPRTAGLPSWVPDFECTGPEPMKAFATDSRFNACEYDQSAIFYFDNDHLILHGYHLTSIDGVSGPGDHYHDIISWFWLAIRACKVRAVPELLINFIHVITASALPSEDPDELQKAFYDYLAVVTGCSEAVRIGRETQAEYIEALGQLMRDAGHGLDVELLKSLAMSSSCRRILDRSDLGSDYTMERLGSRELHQWMRRSARFREFHERATTQRSLITTIDGILGLAPDLSAPNDQIWLFPGSRAPIVLRCMANGNFRVVGEAYIHGYMQGQAFEEGLLVHGNTTAVVLE